MGKNEAALPSQYQNFIHLSRYSRFKWEEGRRETWEETVERWASFFRDHAKKLAPGAKEAIDKAIDEIKTAIYTLDVMPSMRTMMTAGPALERDHIAAYNCSFLAIDRVQAFDELLYILMNGTGVGFSVERQFVTKLPSIAEEFHKSDIVIAVQDSKLGWAKALKELISLLYQGQIPGWDVTKVRKAGEPLMTFGGRASGPEPLVDLFRFAVETFKKAAGRKLSSIECHDLVCKIADSVVVGGVRRSALISLSNLSDDRLRSAKAGQWWENYPHRRLANNSAAYTEKPEIGVFMDEWKALYDSKSGERGIFNREAAKRKCESIGRNAEYDFGTNPCGEILLRDREFCNLSEVVVRADDDMERLKEKVRLAAIIGTLQSTLTDFKYISKRWKENCEDERLLGVSLTGIVDSLLTNGKKAGLDKRLAELREVARRTNASWAETLGVKPSAAITCVKPSGTVSQLVNSGSGIHARHSRFYIRRARMDSKDPMASFMKWAGFPLEADVMAPDHTLVASFPIESPKGAIFRDDMTAVEQLELWAVYREHWCDHNPSITVTVREHEWMEVGAWVYKHFDEMTGVSFLPHSDHVYRQQPYEEVDEAEYKQLVSKMPVNVDWSDVKKYEGGLDHTTGTQELNCSAAGGCEVI